MARSKPKLTEAMTAVFELLEPFGSEERVQIVKAAFALFGDPFEGIAKDESGNSNNDSGGGGGDDPPVRSKAKRWMQQNQVTSEHIDEVFHIEGESAEVIATGVPGNNNSKMTRNCYLLTGIAAFVATDEPKFQDSDAIALCKHMRCFDSTNNAQYRKKVGLGGKKIDGFTLTAPCLREAAALIKSMAASE